jgi:ABC-type polysaccharide/polyol phosphate transport system ATPase subunit
MIEPGEIVADDVHKTFRLYHQSSVKNALLHLARGEPLFERRPVLKGVSFKISRGERVGLVGHNGAGKSTLFRLLSRILRPDNGRIEVGGRVSPLIQLTAGLVPDLSGEENIRLNASVLGLTRREIEERFAAIVDFAELDDFLETPVRYYSTGMQARLGFAVAVHAAADVLLIDEALSVGDVAFQQRCLERMSELTDAGVTVVFVSHDYALVEQFCERVILLDHGRVLADGPTKEVLAKKSAEARATNAP